VAALKAFCLVALASSIWSVDPQVTALKAVILITFYVSVIRLISTYPTREAALRGTVTMVHVLLVWIALQWFFLPSLTYVVDPTTGLRRLNGMLPMISANPLSYLSLMGIVAALLKIGPAWTVRHASLRFLLIVLYGLELLATGTRSALVIGILVVTTSLVFALRHRPIMVSMVSLLSTAGGIVAYTASSVVREFMIRGESEQGLMTLTGRTDIWRVAIDSWVMRPWQGYGYYAGHRIGLPGLQGNGSLSNLDNTWIESLVDVGVIGTCALALCMLALSLHLLRWRTEQWELKLWTCLTVLYGLIVSFVNPTLQTPGSNALLLGMVLIAGGAGVAESPARVKPPLRQEDTAPLPSRPYHRQTGGVSARSVRRPSDITSTWSLRGSLDL
jgi:O-antigen ligase